MKLSKITPRKFIETFPGNGKKVLTPNGYVEIEFVHKTIPYQKYRIELQNGMSLECQENHVLIESDFNEIWQKNQLGHTVLTKIGPSVVIKSEDLGFKENMYDISIKSEDELYYSNGILSHNSGKTISTQIYITWVYLFEKSLNIGICQNKGSTAREFLDKTKQIIINLPIWMQSGTKVWNKGSIENEQGVKILTDVPTSDAFRGYSIHCLSADSLVNVYDKVDCEFKTISLGELYDNCD